MIKDLTVGEPRKVLWKFTLPMFISVIFQQMYNIADSVIVGNFSKHGEDALAAVGASYPITMIFMAIAIGSNIGCSVVISQLFGAKKYRYRDFCNDAVGDFGKQCYASYDTNPAKYLT